MAISSISPGTSVPQQPAATQPQATQPQQTSDTSKSDSGKPASTPAPTVLTQGTAAHHKKKIHHPLPGQPGYQVNKKA